MIKQWIYKKAFEFIIAQHNKGMPLDFTGRDLRGTNFSGATLTNSIFVDSRMEHCSFDGAALCNSVFFQSNLTGASFELANMANADISSANLRRATHQIHVINRQKEQLEVLIKMSEQLQPVLTFLRKCESAPVELNYDLGRFLNKCQEFKGR